MKVWLGTLVLLGLVINSFQDLPFPYGAVGGDNEAAKDDDGVTEIDLNPPLYILSNHYEKIFVDNNGAIWLGELNNFFDISHQPFPLVEGNQMIACYWADSDPSLLPQSKIYYRISRSERDYNIFNSVLSAYGGPMQLDALPSVMGAKMVVVVTYVNVTFSGYSGDLNYAPVNTFQCAMGTDGKHGFVIFKYDELSWTNGYWQGANPYSGLGGEPAVAGIDDGSTAKQQDMTFNLSATHEIRELAASTNLMTSAPGATGLHILGTVGGVSYYQKPLQTVSQKYCLLYYDPHIHTFDGITLASGVLTQPLGQQYVAAAIADCENKNGKLNYPPFAVTYDLMKQHASYPNYPPPVSLVRSATVHLMFGFKTQINVTLYGNEFYVVYNKGKHATSQRMTSSWTCPPRWCTDPVSRIPFIVRVTVTSGGTVLDTDFKLKVSLRTTGVFSEYRTSSLYIYIPQSPQLSDNMIGFCGNNNGQRGDDTECPRNPAWSGTANYANCWTLDYLQTLWNPTEKSRYYKCPTHHRNRGKTNKGKSEYIPKTNREKENLRVKLNQDRMATEKCSALTSSTGPFKDCNVTDLNEWVEACETEMSLLNGNQNTFCAQMENFAQLCRGATPGLHVDWRTALNCPITCPEHSHYANPATACPKLCNDPMAPSFCTLPDLDTCECDEDYVFSGGRCVPEKGCGCLNDIGFTQNVGDTWTTFDCAKICKCEEGAKVSCTPRGCSEHSTCELENGDPVCQCETGYFGNGMYCGTEDHCVNNECRNGGECYTQAEGYGCYCPDGYSGLHCEIPINFCSSSPCVHGSCNSTREGFECTCSSGFTGEHCSIPIDYCGSFPCKNLATCVSSPTGYSCKCPQGFSGVNCEHTSASASLMAAHKSKPKSCEFSCDGRKNGYYEDPCSHAGDHYFRCFGKKAGKIYCQKGYHFDKIKASCVPE